MTLDARHGVYGMSIPSGQLEPSIPGWFGPANQISPLPIDAEGTNAHIQHNLPLGQWDIHSKMARIIEIAIVSRDGPYPKLLPYVHDNNINSTWEVFKGDKHLFEVVPFGGIPSYLTTSIEGGTDRQIQRGLAITIPHAFMHTERGRIIFQMQKDLLEESAVLTLYHMILLAILKAKNHYRNIERRMVQRAVKLRDLLRVSRQRTAVLNRGVNEFRALHANLVEIMKSNGSTPNMMLMPPKTLILLSHMHPSETEHSSAGHEAAKVRKRGQAAVTTMRGVDIYETTTFDEIVAGEMANPLRRKRQYGSFFTVTNFGRSAYLDTYRSDERFATKIMDADRDGDMVLVTGESLLDKCHRFADDGNLSPSHAELCDRDEWNNVLKKMRNPQRPNEGSIDLFCTRNTGRGNESGSDLFRPIDYLGEISEDDFTDNQVLDMTQTVMNHVVKMLTPEQIAAIDDGADLMRELSGQYDKDSITFIIASNNESTNGVSNTTTGGPLVGKQVDPANPVKFTACGFGTPAGLRSLAKHRRETDPKQRLFDDSVLERAERCMRTVREIYKRVWLVCFPLNPLGRQDACPYFWRCNISGPEGEYLDGEMAFMLNLLYHNVFPVVIKTGGALDRTAIINRFAKKWPIEAKFLRVLPTDVLDAAKDDANQIEIERRFNETPKIDPTVTELAAMIKQLCASYQPNVTTVPFTTHVFRLLSRKDTNLKTINWVKEFDIVKTEVAAEQGRQTSGKRLRASEPALRDGEAREIIRLAFTPDVISKINNDFGAAVFSFKLTETPNEDDDEFANTNAGQHHMLNAVNPFGALTTSDALEHHLSTPGEAQLNKRSRASRTSLHRTFTDDVGSAAQYARRGLDSHTGDVFLFNTDPSHPRRQLVDRFEKFAQSPWTTLTRMFAQSWATSPVHINTFRAFFANNIIPGGIAFIMKRPFQQYWMGTGILASGGHHLGVTRHGNHSFEWADNAITKERVGHYGFMSTATVHNGKHVMLIEDCVAMGYIDGENVTFATTEDDVRSLLHDPDRFTKGKIIVEMIPYNRTNTPESPIDLGGVWNHSLVVQVDGGNALEDVNVIHGESTLYYQYKFEYHAMNQSLFHVGERSYLNRIDALNTVLFQGHQLLYNSKSGRFDEVILDDGFFGTNIGKGCISARNIDGRPLSSIDSRLQPTLQSYG